jgi:hypothetical protein
MKLGHDKTTGDDIIRDNDKNMYSTVNLVCDSNVYNNKIKLTARI